MVHFRVFQDPTHHLMVSALNTLHRRISLRTRSMVKFQLFSGMPNRRTDFP